MINYEQMLWDEIPGYSPKEKYEYLQKLERDIVKYKSATDTGYLLFKGLSGTPDTATVKDIRSIIDTGYEFFLKESKS